MALFGREALEEFAAAMEELAFRLLELIARSLDLRPDRLRGFFREQTTYMRVNRYPPCPRPDLRALGPISPSASAATRTAARSPSCAPGRRRRWARRPPPINRRVGACQASPRLARRQHRRHHPGVEQ
ncbi:hypothetical protein PVAP13_9KG101920 [Panicum virgatum]|uniref:Uncharacterized protein n=1 Tax=Panicum virgatum TaxID=38727 RepID=A0A8T0NDF5_PANVG|nr:hypothetical protein PVAP13_9KG101920 [Panicum virgatum]